MAYAVSQVAEACKGSWQTYFDKFAIKFPTFNLEVRPMDFCFSKLYIFKSKVRAATHSHHGYAFDLICLGFYQVT